MVDLSVVNADITARPCDLLVLKHADDFYGVDAVVSERLNFEEKVPEGEFTFLSGRNIEAHKVLYVGVGSLQELCYPQIRAFGRRVLELASNGPGRTQVLCTPLHGPGYGLDEREAFLSLVGGFLDGFKDGVFPKELRKIEIVESNQKKAVRLKNVLASMNINKLQKHSINYSLHNEKTSVFSRNLHEEFSSFGVQSEQKTTLFVAMPFAPEHSDVWDIAIREACQIAGIVCERVDERVFTGNILDQITSRLRDANGVLAVLDGANPNVFLEIGFAWGMGKPTVLIAKKDTPLPFDVRGQKCILYSSIANLRSLLSTELTSLKRQGEFS